MFRLITADVLAGLAQLPDESVQCVITSPPYWGLRDYGTARWEGGDSSCAHRAGQLRRGVNLAKSKVSTRGGAKKVATVGYLPQRGKCKRCGAVRVDSQIGLEPTPADYVARIVEVFRDVRRVLRKDGTLWLNLGDSYSDSGRGTDVGSTLEGTRGNQAECRKVRVRETTASGLRPKNLIGIPWRIAIALQDDGWYLRSDIIWSKPNPMPESVLDRPTKSHEYLFLLSKSERYYYDAEAIKERTTGNAHTRGSGVNPKAKTQAGWNTDVGRHDGTPGGRYREPNAPDKIKSPHGQGFTRRATGPNSRERVDRVPRARKQNTSFSAAVANIVFSRNKRTVWTIATEPFPEAHFATFPTALVEPCILAGSRVGETILDPFNGSGTTGIVALSHQRDYVGIELNPDYVEMSRRRLSTVAPMFAREVTA